MILYLLLHALLFSFVASQSANITEELREAVFNQTSSLFAIHNSTTKPNNVTSSVYINETAEIERELQGNQTFTVITEDDERFQDQQLPPGKHCNADLLVWFSEEYCGEHFHNTMETISKDNWCDLEQVLRPYNDLTVCLERLTMMLGCYFPNPGIQDYFLSIHAIYFHNCTKEEDQPEDAPHNVVVALTIIPVSLIPILVYLVVWRS